MQFEFHNMAVPTLLHGRKIWMLINRMTGGLRQCSQECRGQLNRTIYIT